MIGYIDLGGNNLSFLSALRTIRVLRPLKALKGIDGTLASLVRSACTPLTRTPFDILPQACKR